MVSHLINRATHFEPFVHCHVLLVQLTPTDRMTECVYPNGIESFENSLSPAPVRRIDVLGKGRAALEFENTSMGLAMDSQDIDYYTRLFTEDLKRNPTGWFSRI